MKKTLTVNLNNIVFHIDDDAYDMLQIYLSEIADHFQSEDERKEIMNDIEARIAELFTEKLQKNKNVVNLSDVEEIIEIMGKPSQYTGEDEEPETSKSDKKQKSRRFYRDPENAVLGGIAGGMAAYFGWDVTLVRILLVVLVFLGVGFIIPIYIVVWFVAPQAITASQRLEMQGEDVTVDSIKTEMNNVKNYMESDKFKQSATTIGEKIFEILKIFFKVIFGFIGAVLGIVGVVLVGALILLLFFLIFEPTVLGGFAPDLVSNWSVITPEKMVMLIISLILVVGCPIFLLIYWAIRIVSGRQNNSNTASWVVLILWLAGLFMFYSVGANTFINLHKSDGHPFSINWTDNDSPMVDEVRNCEPFQKIEISGNIELILNQDSVQQVSVSSPEDFLQKVITKVENGVLKVYTEQIFLNRTIKVNISSDSIKSIIAKGACEIDTESQLIAKELSIELLGASQADMDLNISGKLDLEVKGASKVTLTGACNTFNVKGYGASEINAGDFIAKNVTIEVSGANHANVYATERFNAKASGASEVNCKGNPKIINKSDNIGSRIRIE
ncbi:MAG: PspC domain-containing protein [Paludibacter sp.]|nr:PspC domain-containing protein [Paludibacter sp.]